MKMMIVYLYIINTLHVCGRKKKDFAISAFLLFCSPILVFKRCGCGFWPIFLKFLGFSLHFVLRLSYWMSLLLFPNDILGLCNNRSQKINSTQHLICVQGCCRSKGDLYHMHMCWRRKSYTLLYNLLEQLCNKTKKGQCVCSISYVFMFTEN